MYVTKFLRVTRTIEPGWCVSGLEVLSALMLGVARLASLSLRISMVKFASHDHSLVCRSQGGSACWVALIALYYRARHEAAWRSMAFSKRGPAWRIAAAFGRLRWGGEAQRCAHMTIVADLSEVKEEIEFATTRSHAQPAGSCRELQYSRVPE